MARLGRRLLHRLGGRRNNKFRSDGDAIWRIAVVRVALLIADGQIYVVRPCFLWRREDNGDLDRAFVCFNRCGRTADDFIFSVRILDAFQCNVLAVGSHLYGNHVGLGRRVLICMEAEAKRDGDGSGHRCACRRFSGANRQRDFRRRVRLAERKRCRNQKQKGKTEAPNKSGGRLQAEDLRSGLRAIDLRFFWQAEDLRPIWHAEDLRSMRFQIHTVI